MSWQPRLVATDLDGTLLDGQGAISDRTARTLVSLDEAGVRVVFVTGRPLRWMDLLWQHVGDHGIAIVSNGGVVYDAHAHEVVRERAIAPDVAVQVAQRLRDAVPGTAFAVERVGGFGKEEQFLERHPVPDGCVVAPLEGLVAAGGVGARGCVKILARHEELDPVAFWERAESAVGDLVTTTWSSSSAMVEISAAGVTKASTLALLCEDLGVASEEVVAFGDMPNDLPLLEWAGTGYAMANAHPTVIEAADHLAPRHDEDGVAVVLEGLFGLP